MRRILGYIFGIAVLVLIGVAIGAGYDRFAGTPSTELRWKNTGELKLQPTNEYSQLLARDKQHNWETPTVSVYSAPYETSPPASITLKDLSDSGQAHAIDLIFKGPAKPAAAWRDLMSAVVTQPSEPDRRDPYRADRVLIATVTKGLNTLPGDRLLWTRIFIQPINFEFAGYTVAATDSRSIKIASVESSSALKLSVSGGSDAGSSRVGKVDIGNDVERTQKAAADVNEQYENLGVDIQPDFLRIVRESAPGGDVAGNTAIQLSMLTDPDKIWCDQIGQCKRTGQKAQGGAADDQLVLLVSNARLADGETDPKITVLPQTVLPHCPLKANVWMLYELRKITKGRENYVEGSQQVQLGQDGYDANSVDIVPADDIAPAVWSIKVSDAGDKTPITADTSDLTGQVEHGVVRRLVFTDYLTASELAHWLKVKMAAGSDAEPKLNTLTFQVNSGKTLTPFKHVMNDCKSSAKASASN